MSFKLSHPLSIRHASLALGIALMLVSGLMYEYPDLSITVFTVFGSAVFFVLFPVFDTLGEILLIRREERALAPRRKLDDYG